MLTILYIFHVFLISNQPPTRVKIFLVPIKTRLRYV